MLRGLFTLTVVLGVVVSCKSLPEKICYGEHASALNSDAGADPKCAGCLQAKCCEETGQCEDEAGCLDKFRTAHACLLAKGPAAEAECVAPLGREGTRGRSLYNCMRSKCGNTSVGEAECKISNCDVTASAVLLVSSKCDSCFGGSCCKEINECYGDRRCKLAIECIVTRCKGQLGPEMTSFGELGPEAIQRAKNFICNGEPPPPGVDPLPNAGGACVLGCVAEFSPNTNNTPDEVASQCLAFSVYACGARSNCGTACVAGASDAGP